MDNTVRPQLGATPAAARVNGPAEAGVPFRPGIGAIRRPDALPGNDGADRDRGGIQGAPLLHALLDEGLGHADLPPPLELMAALEAAERHAPLADRAVPGLGRLIRAVIGDERFKLARTMDLGR